METLEKISFEQIEQGQVLKFMKNGYLYKVLNIYHDEPCETQTLKNFFGADLWEEMQDNGANENDFLEIELEIVTPRNVHEKGAFTIAFDKDNDRAYLLGKKDAPSKG